MFPVMAFVSADLQAYSVIIDIVTSLQLSYMNIDLFM